MIRFSSTSLILFIAFSGAMTLVGCEGTKETLGLSRRSPDAFNVVLRAPLELPPDYALRPPAPGAMRPQDVTPTDSAARALLGTKGSPPKSRSKVEAVILKKTGADQAPSDIRTVIQTETGEDQDDNTPIGRKLLGLGGSKDEGIIDPVAEKERLDAQKPTPQKK